jgi:Cu/Zn superoxide dismutase
VTRVRKAVVAALAATALLLAPTAAYAHDGHDHDAVAGATTASSMSWAYYSGALTAFTTTPNVFKGARATALMMSVEGSSYFRLRVTGVQKSAAGEDFGVHLHEGTCESGDGSAAGRHYNITPFNTVNNAYEVVSRETEIWLDIDVNSYGNARSSARVAFIPKAGPRSIVLHALPTVPWATPGGPAVGTAGARLACLPFTINSLPSGA